MGFKIINENDFFCKFITEQTRGEIFILFGAMEDCPGIVEAHRGAIEVQTEVVGSTVQLQFEAHHVVTKTHPGGKQVPPL